MALTKAELLAEVIEAIRASGWSALIVTRTHPFDLVMLKEERSYQLRVYIWNVTHGGATRSPNEFRIQITGIELPLQAPPGAQTLLLGWYSEGNVLAAFDPQRHRNPSGASPSIQIPLETLDAAAAAGLAVHTRENDEIALAFRTEFLVAYVKSQASLHEFARTPHELGLLVQAATGQEMSGHLAAVPPARQQILRQVAQWQRDGDFRRRILNAYNFGCAVCGLQLDLVEAAHIVPVGAPGSTDFTTNGLALCPLHHEAYDDSLVGIKPNYSIVVNDTKVNSLRDRGRARREEEFRFGLLKEIEVPADPHQRPQPEYLANGMALRGW